MIHIHHRFSCEQCGSEITEDSYQYYDGMKMLRPCLPWNWQTVEGKLYCDLHRVEVKVKVSDL